VRCSTTSGGRASTAPLGTWASTTSAGRSSSSSRAPLPTSSRRWTSGELERLGQLVRRLHDATSTFTPPADAAWDVAVPADRDDLLCHHDLAPWNLVRDGGRWVFIDWDGAGPGSRSWDLGYAAHGFVPLHAHGDPAVDGPRWRALVDGYGLDDGQRRLLPARTAAHVRGMYELLQRSARTGAQPWARLWAEGHGEHWGPAADYVEAHVDEWIGWLVD
jgi:Ser/Thr protein kinase RdoA (MazF antagonist)